LNLIPVLPGYFRTAVFGLGSIDPAGDEDYWSFSAQAGDRVMVYAEAMPGSTLNVYADLFNPGGHPLGGDDNGGPDFSAYISHIQVPTTGTYYARVGAYSGQGNYQVRVEVVRGMALEFDAGYGNDTMGGANGLSLVQSGNAQLARVAGTVMAPEGANFDEDLYALGLLNAGNVIELTCGGGDQRDGGAAGDGDQRQRGRAGRPGWQRGGRTFSGDGIGQRQLLRAGEQLDRAMAGAACMGRGW
jgi:hypothetical protein